MTAAARSPRRQLDAAAAAAADLVVMGRIGAPFGIKGWVKVITFTAEPETLGEHPGWWVADAGSASKGGWTWYEVDEFASRNTGVVAKFSGCDDRTAAETLTHRDVAVPRADLPELDEDEAYWFELVGFAVVNTQGESLGQVAELFETPANDVMVVKSGDTERLVPVIESVLLDIDREAKRVTVDWGLDY